MNNRVELVSSPKACPYQRFDALPYDMQTLLTQFVDDAGINWEDLDLMGSVLPLVEVEVAHFVPVVSAFDWDDRGPAQVARMRQDFQEDPASIAPIVVGENNSFMDGRHRILAAHALGLKKLIAIDFPAWARSLRPKPPTSRLSRPAV